MAQAETPQLQTPPPSLPPFQTDAASRQSAASTAPPPDVLSPADRYQELFVAVQQAGVFADSKSFVDCAPRSRPDDILAAYRAQSTEPGFSLGAFVHRHFTPQRHAAHGMRSLAGEPLVAHITGLWDELTRHPARHPSHGSLLRLPHRYVVPGGRFVEMYYWDSYFTMLGLAKDGRQGLLHAMTDNFAYLLDTFGHVPNGTRTYYLSRSQPPVFALMAELCEASGGRHARGYLPQMLHEHAFWMDGADGLSPGACHRRVVALPDGALLNRYWDDKPTPREEAWREDMATAALSSRPDTEVFRDLRAAAESGWDFSSRWFDDPVAAPDPDRLKALATLRTTHILPVDLNAFMHKLESSIAQHAEHLGDGAMAKDFSARAEQRIAAMSRYLWNDEQGAFLDYDWHRAAPRPALNAASVTPLFCGCATHEQAATLARAVQSRLLAPGGLATTENASGEQWDKPNGWAPLQWMAVQGFQAYGHADLADEIRRRWLQTVETVYRQEGKLVEKYGLAGAVADAGVNGTRGGGGGGEYPLQDGFGWTNGVVRQWLPDPSPQVTPPGDPGTNFT